MRDEKKFSFILLKLFLVFFKIGLFTFGGGYAMIPLIEEEVSNKRKWIHQSEILDIVAIAESTPGPIAVNAATYIGFRLKGILGAVIATLGLVLPSFIIIFLISLCYQEVMKWSWVIAAFKGIKVAVIVLLLNAVIKLSKSINKGTISIIVFSVILIAYLTVSLFGITIPYFTIMLIALGLVIGLVVTKVSIKKGEYQK